MDLTSLGKVVLVLGLLLAAAGAILWLLGSTGMPLGRLPGDIRIQRDNISCFIPIASMILLSLFLTIVLNIILRLFNR